MNFFFFFSLQILLFFIFGSLEKKGGLHGIGKRVSDGENVKSEKVST